MRNEYGYADAAGTSGTDWKEGKERFRIPELYRWDLTPVFPSDAAWGVAKEELKARLPRLSEFRGTLGETPARLADFLDLMTGLGKSFARLYCYASMRSDEDTRESGPTGMEQEMGQIGAEFAARTAFLSPEVLAMGTDRIAAFCAAESRLSVYRHPLDDILRRREHTGTEGEEKILANAALVSDGPQSIYGIFANADFPYPTVTLSTGTPVKLDQSAFSLHRAAPDREDRKKVFAAYFGSLGEYRRTLGAQLAAEVKKNLFFARSRNYGSALLRALDANAIPETVYRELIRNVRENLGSFHRYLRLRKQLLNLEELHYHDLYVPVVPELDTVYSYERACDHVLASLAPLGEEYGRIARRALAERWVDVYPSHGKRSGAYSNGGVYDVHPYILLNYNGKFDDVSTLAHELGHTMHSALTNAAQPYATSDYSIFVAEVASTFNEALLMEHMLRTLTDRKERLSLLAHELDGIRGTVFRQTQFAEYELLIHEHAERGEGLTGDVLGELYEKLAKEYYGHDRGLCVVDPEIRHEWSHIPHFYYNFYVFQYSTSYTASTALAEMVLAGEPGTIARYLELLKAGGSDYPIRLLQRAGVDMTSAEPFSLTMRRMNRIMDEIESLIK